MRQIAQKSGRANLFVYQQSLINDAVSEVIFSLSSRIAGLASS